MRDKTIWAPLLVVLLVASALCVIRLAESPDVAATVTTARPLKPPSTGQINLAFIISKGANVIDIAGAWEVFQDTMLTSKEQPWQGGDDMVTPFNTYTVSDSTEPVDANGLMVIPNYTFANAPKPHIIVISAQGGRSAAQKSWLLANAQTADVTMSVCTGASMLAAYGLLDGEVATTHHLYEHGLQRYPTVHFVGGMRFVENNKISTAAGLSRASISLCMWWNAITDASSPSPQPITWNITASCGRILNSQLSRQRPLADKTASGQPLDWPAPLISIRSAHR